MNNIRKLRVNKGLTQRQLAEMVSVEQTAVSKWETGTSVPSRETEHKLAEIFNVSLDQLAGREDIVIGNEGVIKNNFYNKFHNIHPVENIKIPMLGNIAAGEPIEILEEREIFILSGSDIKADFCLTVQGDSMIGARIFDGDIVFIKQQPDVRNGQIAAVRIDNEATLKRVYKQNGTISLISENPLYPPIVINGRDGKDVSIIGLAVAFQSTIR